MRLAFIPSTATILHPSVVMRHVTYVTRCWRNIAIPLIDGIVSVIA